ncbi:DUF6498-containing protein [Terricaulis silvestris]|nr:DUF6498-containing protein [Terricaulis silvestris]
MSEPKVPASRGTHWPAIVAVAINLAPIIGVAFWGWNAFALIFLYWLENLVIGARTLASMAANATMGGGPGLGIMFYGPAFALHYGLFCLVHGMFVMAMFGNGAWGAGWGDLASAAFALFAKEPNLAAGFASIVFWQVLQFGTFITNGAVNETDQKSLMLSPYPRIVILHLSIIFGGFLLQMLNEPLAGLLVLALLKTAFDVAEAMGKMPDFVAKLKEHAADYGR